MSSSPLLPLQKTIVGYSDRISVEPGDTIRFMISCHDAQAAFRAEVVRLVCGDDDPNGPGFREEIIPSPWSGCDWPARFQPIDAGSCVEIPDAACFGDLRSLFLQAYIWPTTPMRGTQGILTRWCRSSHRGFGLIVDENGMLALTVGDGIRFAVVDTGTPLIEREWYLATASFDAATGIARISHSRVNGSGRDVASRQMSVGGYLAAPARSFLIGAGQADNGLGYHYHFNGKIERPRGARRVLTGREQEELVNGIFSPTLAADLVGVWDFSLGIGTTAVIDVSGRGSHGRTVNLPGRGVTGFKWTGEEHDWRSAPTHYGAIHFHEDDLADALWKPDLEFEIPPEFESGCYAARISTPSGEDHIPFFVRHGARSTRPRARACVVFSTATYMAYANNHTVFDQTFRELEKGTLLEVRTEDLFLNEHREYGLSTYDTHVDGSGVFYSSRLRPILNMRPKHALWNFNAATHITDWLEHEGFKYDVVTDEDLHFRGYEAIADYSVVISDTHPEYTSVQMWNALKKFQDSAGRMLYLGGNGYYWRISFLPDSPFVIEVRRAENGTRGWASAPGEYHHSSTGEYGGLWRLIGRPPQQLVGVGYIAAGFDVSSYYRRLPASHDARAAFIFEGVDEDIIGDFGVLGGGAAGWELDSFDVDLGSPRHALVLASSEQHSNVYMAAIEETHAPHIALNGIENPKVRADLVFYECQNGGAVFSTGSIAWAASLSSKQYSNNVSRITNNVLRRFLDPTPFSLPAADEPSIILSRLSKSATQRSVECRPRSSAA